MRLDQANQLARTELEMDHETLIQGLSSIITDLQLRVAKLENELHILTDRYLDNLGSSL